MFGRVKLYNFGFVIFTIGSALSSLSQNGNQLVIFRIVQGVGGAFLISNSGAIVVDSFPIEERGKALGLNRVTQVAGAAGGLVLGGFLTTFVGWRSIFWVNIPIGIFGTIWSHYKLKELGTLDKNTKIDIVGNVTFAAGLAAFLIGISLYALGSLSVDLLWLSLAAGIGLFALFVVVENRVEHPMLELSLFKIRPFSGGTLATFLNALARGCLLLVMTAYLQGPTMQLDALVAGLFLIPNSISISIFGPISGWLSDRGWTRFYTTLGITITAISFLMIAQIGAKTTFLWLAIPLFLSGMGQGIFSSPNRASVMTAVEPEQRGVASAVNSMMLMVGNSFSRAFSFLILGFVIPGSVLQTIFSGTSTLASSPTFASEFVSGLHLLFYICAFFVFLSIIPSILRGSTASRSEQVAAVGSADA